MRLFTGEARCLFCSYYEHYSIYSTEPSDVIVARRRRAAIFPSPQPADRLSMLRMFDDPLKHSARGRIK